VHVLAHACECVGVHVFKRVHASVWMCARTDVSMLRASLTNGQQRDTNGKQQDTNGQQRDTNGQQRDVSMLRASLTNGQQRDTDI